jgi:hypothetical protein
VRTQTSGHHDKNKLNATIKINSTHVMKIKTKFASLLGATVIEIFDYLLKRGVLNAFTIILANLRIGTLG